MKGSSNPLSIDVKEKLQQATLSDQFNFLNARRDGGTPQTIVNTQDLFKVKQRKASALPYVPAIRHVRLV